METNKREINWSKILKSIGIIAIIILAIVAVLFAVIEVPLIIDDMFTKPARHQRFAVEWYVDDALGYYGTVLSFIGATILGAVTVFQTRKAHKQTSKANQLAKDALAQTEKANELAGQMQKLEQAKFVSMVSLDKLMTARRGVDSPAASNPEMKPTETLDLVNEDYFRCHHCYHVDIRFKNESDFPIVQIHAHAGDRNNNNALFYGIKPAESAIYIPPHGTQDIRFLIPTTAFEKWNTFGVSMQFRFVNVFDYTTLATLHIDDLTINGVNKGAYRLAKFTDVKPQLAEKTNTTTAADS